MNLIESVFFLTCGICAEYNIAPRLALKISLPATIGAVLFFLYRVCVLVATLQVPNQPWREITNSIVPTLLSFVVVIIGILFSLTLYCVAKFDEED